MAVSPPSLPASLSYLQEISLSSFPLAYSRHNAKPRLDIQKRENLEIALEFMKKVEKIRLENIGEFTLASHNPTKHVYIIGVNYIKLCERLFDTLTTLWPLGHSLISHE